MLPHVLVALSSHAGIFVVWALILAFLVSALVAITGWSRRQEMLQKRGRSLISARTEISHRSFVAAVLDVAAEAAAVMEQFEGLAAQRFVALEMAVQPGLTVNANRRVLQEILGDVVAEAIDRAPCGRVLLSAARVGGRIQITVSDDGQDADRALRASRLRSAQRLAALQGATMDVDARIGFGTSVALRVPLGAADRRSGDRPARPLPTVNHDAAQTTREDSGAER